MTVSRLLIATLAALYLILVYLNAAPFPIHDDYHDSLQFILAYVSTDDAGSLLELFFSQHWEHRQVLNHLLFAAYYELTGGINYPNLLVAANLWIVALLLLYSKLHREPALRIFAALLLFNAAYWNASFWLVAAASNFPVIVLALATLMLLDRGDQLGFSWALPVSLLTCLAFGNGLAILAFGGCALLLQRRWKEMLAWGLWSAVILALYFRGYQEPEVMQAVFYPQGQPDAWQLILASPLAFLHWMLAVIGSGFSFGNRTIAFLTGLLLVTGFLQLLRPRYRREHQLTLLFTGFLLLTLALAAYKRFAITLVDVDLPNRYSFYSICLGLFLGSTVGKQQLNLERSGFAIWAIMACAAVFNVSSWWWGVSQFEAMKQPLRTNMLNWMQGGDKQLYVLFIDEPVATLQRTRAAGIYSPLAAIPDGHKAIELQATGDDCSSDDITVSAPSTALVLRLDRAALNHPQDDKVGLCSQGRSLQLHFDKLPVYLPLPLEIAKGPGTAAG
jgi:hypothetical protein